MNDVNVKTQILNKFRYQIQTQICQETIKLSIKRQNGGKGPKFMIEIKPTQTTWINASSIF